MKMIHCIVVCLIVFSSLANAEVFKCKLASGKTIYQPTPCSLNTTKQSMVKVKEMTPQDRDMAKNKLNAWQQEQAANEALKREQEKQRQLELERQESLALQRRSVIAQEQQAIAAQQKALPGFGNIPIYPYRDPYRGPFWDNSPQNHHHDNHYPHPNPYLQSPTESPKSSPINQHQNGGILLNNNDKSDHKYQFGAP